MELQYIVNQPESLITIAKEMDFKRLQCGAVCVLLLSALCISSAFCDPNNGSFELFDYNETTSSRFNSPINDPNGWHTENFVTVIPVFPDNLPGSKSNWNMNTALGLHPFDGNSLLVLSTGDTSINYSKAWQSITINEGDKITGVYFFGACDYRPWSDWATIKLVSHNNPSIEIPIVYTDIDLLGDYGSFGGWQRFEYIFKADEAGEYDLVLLVNDKNDYQLESYLAVDKIVICRNHPGNPPPEKGDLNCDCTVNFEDFTMFANDWQYDCNNPIMYNDDQSRPQYYDPNCNCLLGTDVNGDGPVDFADVIILSENWLQGIKE